jgi:hypothetical protein
VRFELTISQTAAVELQESAAKAKGKWKEKALTLGEDDVEATAKRVKRRKVDNAGGASDGELSSGSITKKKTKMTRKRKVVDADSESEVDNETPRTKSKSRDGSNPKKKVANPGEPEDVTPKITKKSRDGSKKAKEEAEEVGETSKQQHGARTKRKTNNVPKDVEEDTTLHERKTASLSRNSDAEIEQPPPKSRSKAKRTTPQPEDDNPTSASKSSGRRRATRPKPSTTENDEKDQPPEPVRPQKMSKSRKVAIEDENDAFSAPPRGVSRRPRKVTNIDTDDEPDHGTEKRTKIKSSGAKVAPEFLMCHPNVLTIGQDRHSRATASPPRKPAMRGCLKRRPAPRPSSPLTEHSDGDDPLNLL